jgi:hypothetical protein
MTHHHPNNGLVNERGLFFWTQMVGVITTLCAYDKQVRFLKYCVHSEYTLIDEIQRPNDHNTLFTASLAPTHVLTCSLTQSPHQSLHCQPSKLTDEVLPYLLFPVTLLLLLSPPFFFSFFFNWHYNP